MKKTIIKFAQGLIALIFAAIAVIGLALPFTAAAIDEEYGAVTAGTALPTLAGGTNNVAPATVQTYPTYWNLTQHDQAALLLSFKGNHADLGVSPQTFTFAFGPDSTTKATLAPGLIAMTFAANGTTTVNYVTNLNVEAHGYLHLVSLSNTNTAYSVTNLTIKVYTKPIRQGYRL
jgi:hypothetical protein